MILSKIKQTIQQYNMLSIGDTVAVAVSGGADSMCLLHCLTSLREEWQLTLLVLNVEHGIRGESSVRDSAFVKRYCEQHGIPFKGISVDVPAEAAKTGKGIEETARILRYAFFERVDAEKIATAHNASDNLETVLFRLVRGTGMKGACGIPPVRGRVIRPLIDCSGTEIRQYCEENDVPYITDETNADNRYARNYIRNEIIPSLQTLNPSFEEAGTRLIHSISEAERFLDRLAEDCLRRCLSDGRLRLDVLRGEDSAIVKRVVVKWLAQSDIVTDEVHLNGITLLLHRRGKYQLKNVYYVISDGTQLRLAVWDDAEEMPLHAESQCVSLSYFDDHPALQEAYDFACDADRVCGDWTVRFRREGDRISPAGRGVTKTLKKLYNEERIPPEVRRCVPLVADEKGVIGVVGYCTDERVVINSDTQRVLLIKILMEDKH